MWQCYYCRLPLSVDVQHRNRMCPNCGSDIHCCKNCVHYEEDLSSKCNEPHSEWIRDRSVQNSCSFFEFKSTTKTPEPKNNERTTEAERAKEAFRALFRAS